MKILYLIVLTTAAFLQAYSQSYTVGGNFGIVNNTYTSDFKGYQGFEICCAKYGEASGVAPTFSLFGEKRIKSNFSLGMALGYGDLSAEYLVNQTIPVGIDGRNVDGNFDFYLENNLTTMNFTPYAKYDLGGIFVTLGPRISLPLSAGFVKEDRLQSPDELLFADGSNIYGAADAEIPNVASVLYSAEASLGYAYRFGAMDNWQARLSLSGIIGINEIVENTKQQANTLVVSLGVAYTLQDSKKTINKEIYQIDTIRVERELASSSIDLEEEIIIGKRTKREYEKLEGDQLYSITEISGTDTVVSYNKEIQQPVELQTLVAKLEATGINKDGKQTPLNEISVRIRLTNDIYPLLPFIFFDDRAHDIPDRYNTQTDINNFQPKDIYPSPIDYHRNNLNFIGINLVENPGTTITITGYADRTTENADCSLAKRRAESVKSYLSDRFGISSSRLIIKQSNSSCAPNNETRTQSESGYAENRRVEISSKDASKVFAVSRVSYSEPMELEPVSISVQPEVYVERNFRGEIAKDYDATWNLEMVQDGSVLFAEEGFGKPEASKIQMDRKISTNIMKGQIQLKLTAEYRYFKESEVLNIRVVKDTLENEVQSLSLALFDVSSSKLTTEVRQSLREFLKNLPENAEISITGYSDNLGDSANNKRLSKVRAEAVAREIRTISKGIEINQIKGVGSDSFPPGIQKYSSPEERFISRTVQIQISNSRYK